MPREQAGQDHEEQIVAGVERGERQHQDAADEHQALARDAVVDANGQPAQRRAARQRRHDGDGHPSGDAQRGERDVREASHTRPFSAASAGIESQQKRARRARRWR